MKVRRGWRALSLAAPLMSLASGALADGTTVDKVYHPYVEPLEYEVEWRMLQESTRPATGQQRHQLHRVGFGRAVTERLFTEVYLFAEGDSDSSLSVTGYELEALWQLSEQGEYDFDYGLLFELEHETDQDIWEFGSTLLIEREIGRYSFTANASLFYETGERIQDEVETALALQTRYRWSPSFEPTFELHKGEDTFAVGPGAQGMERLGIAQAVRWEVALLLGVDNATPDTTLRLTLEYEF